MRRKIIARLLVFCMIVSMLAVPAMAVDYTYSSSSPIAWSGNAYTLQGNTTLSSYTIANGTYKLTLD